MNCSFSNLIWLLSLARKNNNFKKSLNKPGVTQWNILKKYLENNNNTIYGKKHSFTTINTIDDFQKQVPIINYEDIEEYIQTIGNNNNNILSKYKTRFFEETSGSGRVSKIIPYNRPLKDEFNAAIAPWIWGIYKDYPKVFKGKSYWSISPPMKPNWKTKGGLKVGIEDDSEYLNYFGKLLHKHLILNPIQKKQPFYDADAFYINTLKCMIAEKKMGFISVWSPSFILQLDKILRKYWVNIVPESLNITPDAKWSKLFPSLKLVSCWLHASSSQFNEELENILGNISIQPKGLLSTEGVVSIPIDNKNDPVLAVTSHFYEFECQRSKKIYLTSELIKKEQYEVIMSTGNGFMRYRTNDIIQVSGFIQKTPTIVFKGRKNRTSDLVGEKLTEIMCIEILNSIDSDLKIEMMGAYFHPSKNENNQLHYTLNIVTESHSLNKTIILEFVEKLLYENPYYSQAISAQQLEKLKVIYISYESYLKTMNEYFMKKKIKSGNQKPPVLFLLNELT